MDDAPRAPSRAVVPWGFIGMLVLVLLVERYIAAHPLEYTDPTAFTWRSVAKAARGPEGRSDVLMLGDSMVKVGGLPRVIEKSLEVSAYNLALFGGQAPSTYYVLRKVIESGARPRAIVVDFHANLLPMTPKEKTPYWSELLDPGELAELMITSREAGLVAGELGGWLLPSYKGRGEIRSVIHSALLDEDRSGARDRLSMARNWAIHGGAHLVIDPHKPFAPIDTNPSSRAAWKIHPVNLTYLRRFFELARSHELPVFWLVPPTHPNFQVRRERLGLDEAFTQFIRGIQNDFPNVVVVDGRRVGYGPSLFLDLTHLNTAGAQDLSTSLAKVLAAHFSVSADHPRWVTLGPHDAESEAAPVKSVAEGPARPRR